MFTFNINITMYVISRQYISETKTTAHNEDRTMSGNKRRTVSVCNVAKNTMLLRVPNFLKVKLTTSCTLNKPKIGIEYVHEQKQ